MPVSKQFVLAGHAIFTISSPDGKHRTYRVDRVPPKGQYKESWFVKTLVGPINTDDYAYLGKLDPHTGQVTTTFKSAQWSNTMRLKVLNRVLARVWSGDHAAYQQHGYDTKHAGKCGKCGRLLTVPESIESGIGPECAKAMGLTPAKATKPKKEVKPVVQKTFAQLVETGVLKKPNPKPDPVSHAIPSYAPQTSIPDYVPPKTQPTPRQPERGLFISDEPGLDTSELEAHYTPGPDSELTHWTGNVKGQYVIVYND